MPLKEKSRFHKWKDTTTLEIKKVLALIIAMGLVSHIDVSEYWTINPVTATPFFPSVMSRDRFLLILAFFHLKDNRYYVPRGPFYERMLSRFRTVYKPHQALAIDESMAREFNIQGLQSR